MSAQTPLPSTQQPATQPQTITARVQYLANDPDFHALPDENKIQVLSHVDPGFQKLAPAYQAKVVSQIAQNYQDRQDQIKAQQDKIRAAASIIKPAEAFLQAAPGGNLVDEGVYSLSKAILGGNAPPNVKTFGDAVDQAAQAYGLPASTVAHPVTSTAAGIGGGALTWATGEGLMKAISPAATALTNMKRTAVALPALGIGLNTITGHQSPLNAAVQLPLQIGSNLIGLKSFGQGQPLKRLANAAFQGTTQGAGAFAGSLLNDATSGRPLNWQQAWDDARKQAAIAAGMGLMMKNSPANVAQTAAPQRTLYGQHLNADFKGRYNLKGRVSEDPRHQQYRDMLGQQIAGAHAIQSTTEQGTYKAILGKLDKLHKELSQSLASNDPEPIKAITREKMKEIKDAYDKVNAEYQKKYPKQQAKANPTKERIAGTPNEKDTYEALVRAGIKAMKQGKAAWAKFQNTIGNRYHKDEAKIIKGKIGDKIEENKAKYAAYKNKAQKAKAQRIAEENKLLEEQKAKQQEEEKQRALKEKEGQKSKEQEGKKEEARKKIQAKGVKAMDDQQIEDTANKLLEHFKNNEKGQLGAKLDAYRKASKADFTKNGLFSEDEAHKINESSQKVLDRFAQKKEAWEKANKEAAQGKSEDATKPVKAQKEQISGSKDAETVFSKLTHQGLDAIKANKASWADFCNKIGQQYDPNDVRLIKAKVQDALSQEKAQEKAVKEAPVSENTSQGTKPQKTQISGKKNANTVFAKLTQQGAEAIKTSKAAWADFCNKIGEKYIPNDVRLIKAKVQDALAKEKADQKASKTPVATKQTAKASPEKTNNSQNEELEQQRANAPKVLDNADIEKTSDELLNHLKKNEKGQLDAKLDAYKKASKADFTKKGLFDKDRAKAINLSYQKVLDRFAQKTAEWEESQKKQSLTKKVEAKKQNLTDLNRVDHNYDTGTFKQHDVGAGALTYDDIEDHLSEDEKKMAQPIEQAMQKDAKVTIRYDAERTGDTGTFEYKKVSPISWGFKVGEDGHEIITFKAYNENGHLSEYYLQPSEANAKTGTISAVLETPTYHEGSEGTAFRGTEPNVYKGPREGKISDIMGRPYRETVGLTSENRKLEQETRDLLDAVDKNRQPGSDKEGVSAKEFKETLTKYKKNQTLDSAKKAEDEPGSSPLQPDNSKKEAWQKTLQGFRGERPPGRMLPTSGPYGTVVQEFVPNDALEYRAWEQKAFEHYSQVHQAMIRGEQIPSQVLNEYPELKKDYEYYRNQAAPEAKVQAATEKVKDTLQSIKKGEKVHGSEIIEPSKYVPDEHLQESLENAGEKANQQVYEDNNKEPC